MSKSNSFYGKKSLENSIFFWKGNFCSSSRPKSNNFTLLQIHCACYDNNFSGSGNQFILLSDGIVMVKSFDNGLSIEVSTYEYFKCLFLCEVSWITHDHQLSFPAYSLVCITKPEPSVVCSAAINFMLRLFSELK